jgi:malate dehydrogenase
MKTAIIGAGNVGGLAGMRLAEAGLAQVCLVDAVNGFARGKAFDLEDAQGLVRLDYAVKGSDDISDIKDADLVVIAAGVARKPGMTREDLLNKNAQILKDICLAVKKYAAGAILLVVTNPLDLMTQYVLKVTGFDPKRVLGMGISLDSSRFAHLISQELGVSVSDVRALVIGVHGEGMLPLPRLTTVKGIALDEVIDDQKIENLVRRTIDRGKEIVSLLASGSAYFAPSAGIVQIACAVLKDEKRTLGVSAYLQGEYGARDICLGVPCRLGREGIEQVVELDLHPEEKQAFLKAVASLKEQYSTIAMKNV